MSPFHKAFSASCHLSFLDRYSDCVAEIDDLAAELRAFADKQSEYRTGKVAAFKINHEFATASRWTHVEIDRRTISLLDDALQLWRLV